KIKVSTSYKHKQQSSENIHYDTPTTQDNDESLILTSNHLVTSSDVEKNTASEPPTTMITFEKVCLYADFLFSSLFFFLCIYNEQDEK
ncbi:unnamed protein product, partial [Rotaria magnacalcarata]